MFSVKSSLRAVLAFACCRLAISTCPDYSTFSEHTHIPLSNGTNQLSYQRPIPACRTFYAPEVERLIFEMQAKIADHDLYRLFENAFPNTLDTTVAWRGVASSPVIKPGLSEELAFLITGDINAMWLRDSANQLHSYRSLLHAGNVTSDSRDSLAALFRGVINLQARYILNAPYCNAFQPPAESNISPSGGSGATVFPPINNTFVYECKYELDSLAAFLQISNDYWVGTGDSNFFGRYSWQAAIGVVLELAQNMTTSTYAPDGSVLPSYYEYENEGTTGTEVLTNGGTGNPVQSSTGLIRSLFRPSDDATIFQLFIPANMMFSSLLNSTSFIAKAMDNQMLAARMSDFARSIDFAIKKYAVITPHFGGDNVFAYEVDGYGSQSFMDDANIPSLLSAPLYGYVDVNDSVYQATRKMILSLRNPYWAQGSALSAVGGPHVGPGHAWPMASIVRIMTSNDDKEITGELQQLISSTNRLGLIHESVLASNQSVWTRSWFAWANGLFGEMILDLAARKPDILLQSFQGNSSNQPSTSLKDQSSN